MLLYRIKCSAGAAPLAGFIYLIFNSRFDWLKGTLGLVVHTARQKLDSESSRYRSTAPVPRQWLLPPADSPRLGIHHANMPRAPRIAGCTPRSPWAYAPACRTELLPVRRPRS